MGKGKLAKFAEMAQNPLVFEPRYNPTAEKADDFALQGNWNREFFHNQNPIVLELGCGRGEYTVGLAQLYPDRNFIGVDIKGSRMWTGATDALNKGLRNVAFLRTNIEFIWQFFGKDEVSEIWLTFSDPQMKKATKRLSSTYFLERYRRFMTDSGLIHLKTDSNFLFTYTQEMLKANGITPEVCTRDLYKQTGDDTVEARSFQTYYEGMWRDRGIDIKYLRFRLPQQGTLTEPDVEIPLDEYRSYSREKRSSLATSK
ncbi:MAG: tRNA (guanosine(46)-N7)-methyltransferase TrmB [Bacteroidaceae bacterium]|nr:tRNA (guanosine(46)-N7)-methyltransferase TrmB [Bacteroidaceae bacterium]MBQ2073815.1 tRNA (guanosine(46)-N7)-methyltransferase TrmB [Bacteroidaceae bacterium]